MDGYMMLKSRISILGSTPAPPDFYNSPKMLRWTSRSYVGLTGSPT